MIVHFHPGTAFITKHHNAWRWFLLFGFALLAVFACPGAGQAQVTPAAERTRDSAEARATFRGQIMGQQDTGEPITFDVAGSTLHGRFFRAADAGLRPTLMLFHGYPGGKGDVMGIAQAVAKAGWNTLVFRPRGWHDSEGTFSLENSLIDVRSALHYLQSSANQLNVDTARLAAAGYSFGGWLALMSGIQHAELKCVATLAPATVSAQLRADPGFRTVFEQILDEPIKNGQIRGTSGSAIIKEILADSLRLDPGGRAAELAKKPVLVIGGWRDTGVSIEGWIASLVRALRRAGNQQVTPVTVDDDHTFRQTRPEIQLAIAKWLTTSCN